MSNIVKICNRNLTFGFLSISVYPIHTTNYLLPSMWKPEYSYFSNYKSKSPHNLFSFVLDRSFAYDLAAFIIEFIRIAFAKFPGIKLYNESAFACSSYDNVVNNSEIMKFKKIRKTFNLYYYLYVHMQF